MILDYSKEDLVKLGGIHTAAEIEQQPAVWEKVYRLIAEKKFEIERFLQQLNKTYPFVRVILTGAGTSAYVGETILPYLQCYRRYEHFYFESIPTTDLVSSPYFYFQEEIPTLLVSFARSGNSPESVAASQLGEQIVKHFYQIIITCNKDGHLAKNAAQNENSLLLLMPEETNDKGFAMTSSFTAMLLAAILALQTENLDNIRSWLSEIVNQGKKFLQDHLEKINEIADWDFGRIVYLGSGPLKGLARESALKMLELTGGKTVTAYESSLGFRHGPKSIIDDKTVVVMYISGDSYTRKYDIDMMKEIYTGRTNSKVVALTQNPDDEIQRHCHYLIDSSTKDWPDIRLAFLYIIFAQTLALKKSIKLGIAPDNPSPAGIVNRVVKGVTIYPYK